MGEARRRAAERAARGPVDDHMRAEVLAAFAKDVAQAVRRHRIGSVASVVIHEDAVQVVWAAGHPKLRDKAQRVAYFVQESVQALLAGPAGPAAAASLGDPNHLPGYPEEDRRQELLDAGALLGIDPETPGFDPPRENWEET
jgi:hypothetical protein